MPCIPGGCGGVHDRSCAAPRSSRCRGPSALGQPPRHRMQFRGIAQIASVASVIVAAGTIALVHELPASSAESPRSARGAAPALADESIRSLRREALVAAELQILPERLRRPAGAATGLALLKPRASGRRRVGAPPAPHGRRCRSSPVYTRAAWQIRSAPTAARARRAIGIADRLLANIETVVQGKREEIRLVLTALACNGHVLFEDVPGTAKTVLARAVSQSIDGVDRDEDPVHAGPAADRRDRPGGLRPAHAATSSSGRGPSSRTSCSSTRSTGRCRRPSRRCSRRWPSGR